eukprot:scaffold36690_cov30-Tisochrysis_lutea.AAC.1
MRADRGVQSSCGNCGAAVDATLLNHPLIHPLGCAVLLGRERQPIPATGCWAPITPECYCSPPLPVPHFTPFAHVAFPSPSAHSVACHQWPSAIERPMCTANYLGTSSFGWRGWSGTGLLGARFMLASVIVMRVGGPACTPYAVCARSGLARTRRPAKVPITVALGAPT